MAKRGRPRDDSIRDFSVEETPVRGIYLVRFWIEGKAFCVSVRYGVPYPEGTALTRSPYETFCEIAETLRTKGARSASAETLAHRLTTKFREWRKARCKPQGI